MAFAFAVFSFAAAAAAVPTDRVTIAATGARLAGRRAAATAEPGGRDPSVWAAQPFDVLGAYTGPFTQITGAWRGGPHRRADEAPGRH